MILQRIKVNCLEIDDATVNGVDGTENKGELLRDDDTINGVNGRE